MSSPSDPVPRREYVPAIGPRLHYLLWVVLGGFALLGVNSAYLGAVTFLEWRTGATYQNYFYQWMFLGHLALGLLLVVPVIVFGIVHIRNAHHRPNRRAVRVGYALFVFSLLLIATGFGLARLDVGGIRLELRDPGARRIVYWLHVAAPLVCIWLFVLHRLAGKRIKWKIGVAWAGVAAVFALVMVLLHSQDPRQWNVVGPESGEQYFFPSLARTATGNFIPAEALMMDGYCKECHPDSHEDWSSSVHKFASFNNPAYLFAVRETRQVAMERDGDVQASRFCAGCHDPVPFFSGAFDDPNFDDVNHPTSQAGVTCTVCHAITHVNSNRGNSDFTIEEPVHYPFAYSENELLGWINRQLVKAKPDFHKKTFLKPLHQTAEYCAGCHKVHLPEELNDYKWLRGQNTYDPYLLSGVSGHGAQSFYYPEKAEHDCNGCHMPLSPSEDFGARDFDDSGERKIHDHQFPSANTAVPYLLGLGEEAVAAHGEFNEGVMRVDVFGVREDARIDGELHAPLRPTVPALVPGKSYLIDVVIRTLKMGHLFTQGTSDSNEVWLDVTARSGSGIIGRSGGKQADGEVDPWSHFVNAYVIDRDGNRIDRRNPQDIFVALYNHQIPPGAGDVVHYALDVPEDARGTIELEVALQYRKFDTTYLRYFQGAEFDGNDLPIMTLATDRVVFPVGAGAEGDVELAASEIPEWQRWNDWGIGLLRKGNSGANKGELRQAELAFAQVEELGRPDGPLNLARVLLKEGRLEEAAAALNRASAFDPPAYPWTVAWFTGLVNKQNGYLDEALESFRSLYDMWETAEAREREFDFRQDYRVLNELGQTTFEQSKRERGDARRERREALMREAIGWFEQTLEIDPENLSAHFNLALIKDLLGEEETAAEHRMLHARYKTDDNARDFATSQARIKNPAADHAAEAVVIYELSREGAYELPGNEERARPLSKENTQSNAPEEELVAADDAIIGRAFRWSLSAIVVLAAGGGGLWLLTRPDEEQVKVRETEAVEARALEVDVTPPRVRFTDVTTAAGVDFVHESGARGEKLLPETMGGGVAFLDREGDGDQDLVFANGAPWPRTVTDGDALPSMALFDNDGTGRFSEETADAGLERSFYGMGLAVGDVDGDGDQDLFATAVGENHLFANEAGRFESVTARAGVAGAPEEWSTSAAFFDLENDGDLDLFVCNYVRWSHEIDAQVDYRLTGVGRAYGPPTSFEGSHCYLYRNAGDGLFEDVSEAAGVQVANPATGVPSSKALGVGPCDVDSDGLVDLMVANDTVRNFFFHNRGDGTFEETGVLFGVGFDRSGNSTGAMGVDSARFRNDDSIGFAIGNFANEMSSLYVSQNRATRFADESITEGIGAPTRSYLSFGLFFFDYDLDGRLDLLQANGHLEEEINTVQASQHYEQPAQLFWNAGDAGRSTFVEVGLDDSGDLARPIVGRGSAYADVDGDGDLDVVLTQTGGAPLVLRNDQALGHHWLRVVLEADTGNRHGIGAWIELEAGGVTQKRQVMPARSYLSSAELPVTFGLGSATKVDALRVRWPGGALQEVPAADLGLDRTLTVRRP